MKKKAKEELENENTINEEAELDEEFFKLLYNMPKGGKITVNEMSIKEGETTPPKKVHIRFDYSCHGECRSAY